MSSEPRAGEVVASVRGLGKRYEVYAKPIDRLKQTLWRGRRRFFGEFWALRGVEFELRAGEALGIIGRNGAGKSTLLQILAGTLEPTEGQADVRRRVAALLELGSGFDPEFTGRENVYLNGVILGLDEREMDARFGEIERFAEIGGYMDQPVKTYSTGMTMRLAFAVQVLLDPEILIVDEALAVGDVAFQVKCMDHMRGLLERGVTVILVTHEVNTVRSFCDRVLWLDHGRQRALGEPREVTNDYMAHLVGATAEQRVEPARAEATPAPAAAALAARDDLRRWGEGWAELLAVRLLDAGGRPVAIVDHGDTLRLELEYELGAGAAGRNLGLAFSLRNPKGLDIVCYTSWEEGLRLDGDAARFRARFELENILAPGDYVITAAVEDVQGHERHYGDYVENALQLTVGATRPVFSNVLPAVRHHVERAGSPTRTA